MLNIRPAEQRGHAEHGWLDSRHSFSFADYYDPAHMGFGALRVINEDRVAPAMGFGAHPHRDMEIISYVLEGALQHRDSMGTGSLIRPGDVQRMSAGTGVLHSEYNPSQNEGVHFLQIWIEPNVQNVAPSYEEKHFDRESKLGRLRLVVSPDGREGSVSVYQDAKVYAAILDSGDQVKYELASGRAAYVHLIRGRLTANGVALASGDALKVSGESLVALSQAEDAEVLLFDLPY